MHKVHIPADIIERVKARRGRVHPFEQLDGPRTALVVIDLQNAFMLPGSPVEVKTAREIVPNVNRLANAVRAAGGMVVWVQMSLQNERQKWSVLFDHFGSPARAAAEQRTLSPGDPGHELYAELDVQAADLVIEKTRFSAFIQGSSDLDRILRGRGIDTVVIVGTVTNTCCESSARDAMMLNYKTVFVSDANAAHTDEEHNATLANMLRMFADVLSTDEVAAGMSANATSARSHARSSVG